MKRSLLTVCSLLLAVGLVGCAVEERGDDGLPLGESRQDLALDAAVSPAADAPSTETPGERPEPEPWRSTVTAANGAVLPGPGPAPDSDPRRFTAGEAAKAAGGEERPEPEPWQPKDTSVSLTKNK